ncbi:MAG TPA: TolC family protein [Prolixibacteraceae bacterium]|nr:TolC family protein [Prolixibacteraceae bacterium]
MKQLLLILPFLFLLLQAKGQTVLTLDEAIALALKHNFDITLARNDALYLKTNNTAGAAGMLPNISLSGSGQYALRNVVSSESETNTTDAYSLGVATLNSGIELSWTLFDGGKMFVTKNKLNELEAMGEIQYKAQVQQTLSEVIAAYYNIVKQKQQLASIEQTIRYNLERVKISETGYNAGSRKKTDLLQARIDLNVNRENAIVQQAAIAQARRELARMLYISETLPFDVYNDFTFDYQPDREQLLKEIYGQNNRVQVLQKRVDIQDLVVSESRRSLFPKINLLAGYYLNNTGTTLLPGTSLSTTRTLWPQAGGSVSVPLFMGGNLQRQLALAKIDREQAEIELEKEKLKVYTELLNALTAFEKQQELLKIEQENCELTKESLEISLQRMRLGEATSLEVRLAQEDFEQSSTRLTNFRYSLKIAETNLKKLLGKL